MSGFADGIVDALRERVRAAAEQLAAEVRDDLQVAVSEPYPPASEPGDPPHLRTSLHRGSIEWEALVDENSVRAIVFSDGSHDIPLAKWLEEGTGRMAARPHFGPAYEKWRAEAIERFATAIKS